MAGDTLSNQIAKMRERAADAYRDGNMPLFRELDAKAGDLEFSRGLSRIGKRSKPPTPKAITSRG